MNSSGATEKVHPVITRLNLEDVTAHTITSVLYVGGAYSFSLVGHCNTRQSWMRKTTESAFFRLLHCREM